MSRTRRVHVSLNDARHIVGLALLIEDRTPDEQEALVRVCAKIEHHRYASEPDMRWTDEAHATYLPDTDSEIETVNVTGAVL